MKKIMTMISAMMVAATMNAENIETEAFTETLVTVPARVRFVRGDNYSFSVESENKIVAESVKAAVKDGTLYFSLKNGLSVEEASENDLTIVITAPGMPEFKTSRNMKAVEIKSVSDDDKNSFTYNK
ncbi:MAG: hypothetical protein J5663_07815 [Bacteroidaceae bacterium]|nr:hypothetical protein [Bacteroidaceae bacterium]